MAAELAVLRKESIGLGTPNGENTEIYNYYNKANLS
jgi:hypothetical protein